MRRGAALLLALVASCGKPPELSGPANPPGYETWQRRNFIISQTFSGGGRLPGSIDIDPGLHTGGPDDWMEVNVNGNKLGRHPGATGRIHHELPLRPGANWIRFFSSASRLGWEFQIDTHDGTRFYFTPKDKVEWDMSQQKDE